MYEPTRGPRMLERAMPAAVPASAGQRADARSTLPRRVATPTWRRPHSPSPVATRSPFRIARPPGGAIPVPPGQGSRDPGPRSSATAGAALGSMTTSSPTPYGSNAGLVPGVMQG